MLEKKNSRIPNVGWKQFSSHNRPKADSKRKKKTIRLLPGSASKVRKCQLAQHNAKMQRFSYQEHKYLIDIKVDEPKTIHDTWEMYLEYIK